MIKTTKNKKKFIYTKDNQAFLVKGYKEELTLAINSNNIKRIEKLQKIISRYNDTKKEIKQAKEFLKSYEKKIKTETKIKANKRQYITGRYINDIYGKKEVSGGAPSLGKKR